MRKLANPAAGGRPHLWYRVGFPKSVSVLQSEYGYVSARFAPTSPLPSNHADEPCNVDDLAVFCSLDGP